MADSSLTPENIQQGYYKDTANKYDNLHILGDNDTEHTFSLFVLSSMIRLYEIRSILDIGAGTGRTIEYVRANHPEVNVIGIEPVKELREVGHKTKNIPENILIEGDGNNLSFPDGSYDLVCEFGVLHHVPDSAKVVAEMLRVSKKAIFISDSNNFGQGGMLARSVKQALNFLNLWGLANFISTKGKKYKISEGDGLYYSYSVFNNYDQIKAGTKKIFIMNTKDGGRSIYRTASHLCLFALK